jgi:hypothetical protein
LIALCAGAAVAGPLDPPAGPVAPTLKTLSEVEPRIAINATNTPGDADSLFRITSPGSYYLTGNVVVGAGLSGIEIESADVTIDCMGFTIRGEPGSLDGIRVPGGARANITIRNGVVRDFGQDGIDLRHSGSAFGGVIESMVATNNGGSGITSNGSSVIRECVATNNAEFGILAGTGSVIEASTAQMNGQGGILGLGSSTVASCTAIENSGSGISVGDGGLVLDSSAQNNTVHGIAATQGPVVISRCVAEGNGLNGILSSADRSCATMWPRATGAAGWGPASA